MTNDHPPPDTPKILEVLEPFVDFCACQMRFGANDFAHRHDPHRGHGLHDNLVRRDYKISVFKKRIGIKRRALLRLSPTLIMASKSAKFGLTDSGDTHVGVFEKHLVAERAAVPHTSLWCYRPLAKKRVICLMTFLMH